MTATFNRETESSRSLWAWPSLNLWLRERLFGRESLIPAKPVAAVGHAQFLEPSRFTINAPGLAVERHVYVKAWLVSGLLILAGPPYISRLIVSFTVGPSVEGMLRRGLWSHIGKECLI